MIRCYTIDKLPREYYGKTYDIFSFEVFNHKPQTLYFGNKNDEVIAIIDICPLYDFMEHGCCLRPIYTDGTEYIKSSRKYRKEEKERIKTDELKLNHKLDLFKIFLNTITINKTNSDWPVDHDICYAHANFYTSINVIQK